jgi:hypothetical protein
VVYIRHAGEPNAEFALTEADWEIMSTMSRSSTDRIVHKKLNDSFFETTLQAELVELGAGRVLVTGWATDQCVDATVRSAVALGFEVVVVEDCHTVVDRPHLSAEGVIEHHNYVWANLIPDARIRRSCTRVRRWVSLAVQMPMLRLSPLVPPRGSCRSTASPSRVGAGKAHPVYTLSC